MEKTRKIIHIDMDCFYAAIEIRDNPSLIDKPVAVGGMADRRGVLCTCNYIARKYGVSSAMPTSQAYNLCPDLVLLPVDMDKYKMVAKRIHQILYNYTDLVEPLALDEAYLDVTSSNSFQSSATLIAEAIRQEIYSKENLTASAGIAPNKFLAKIASGWKKPNGIFTIPPTQIEEFVKKLPIAKLYGVGKVAASKLNSAGFRVCSDLRTLSINELTQLYGKLGQQLYNQCRGIDNRVVEPNRERKSLSVETTLVKDIISLEECLILTQTLYNELVQRIRKAAPNRLIKNQFVKIKYNDFSFSSSGTLSNQPIFEVYKTLIKNCYEKSKKPVRLLGLGVHFQKEDKGANIQCSLF